MRTIISVAALLLTTSVVAQNDPFWNPDANGDDIIGATDLQSFLSVYGASVGIDSSVTCTFEGTEFQQWIVDVFNEVIVIDSVYFETTLSGVYEEYVLGCPDPVEVTWSVSEAGVGTMDNAFSTYEKVIYAGYFSSPVSAFLLFRAEQDNGTWFFNGYVEANTYSSVELYSMADVLTFGGNGGVPNVYSNVVFDSLGIRVVNQNPNNYVRAVPFWHYTE